MIGSTLIDIRTHIEALASDDGQYYVVCGRTGARPVPSAGKRFSDRETAQAAARATEQYREALRRYDPQVPYYDLIVCEDPGMGRQTDAERLRASTADTPQRTLSEPVLDDQMPAHRRRDRIEFCHRVAGAVFETLSAAAYDAVETAVMNAYVELAESIEDPDELCLCLLESMATELGDRLDPSEQADIIATAADRLDPVRKTTRPLAATLSTLENRGLIEHYSRSPWSAEFGDGIRSTVVRLSGYALSPHEGQLPVLPLTLELSRYTLDRLPQLIAVTAADDGWHLTIWFADEGGQTGVVNAPIEGEV